MLLAAALSLLALCFLACSLSCSAATPFQQGDLPSEQRDLSDKQRRSPKQQKSSSSKQRSASNQQDYVRRSVQFPEQSVGWVYFTVAGDRTERNSKAKGIVTIPAGLAASLTLSGAATDQGLGFLAKIKPNQFQGLTLANLEIGDQHVRYLRNFKGLVKLDISSTDITDKGLAQLIAMFPTIQTTSLARTRITAKSMPAIASGWKSLDKLVLSGVKLGPKSLGPLKDLKDLHHLDLDMADIADSDLVIAGKFTDLKELDLSGNPRITDKGIAHLTNLKNLNRLDLMDTSVTGDCEKYVAQMPRLKKLRVRAARLKEKELIQLRAAVKHGKVEDPAETLDMELFAPLHDGYLERNGESSKSREK